MVSEFAPKLPHLRTVDHDALDNLERDLGVHQKQQRPDRLSGLQYAANALDRLRHRDMRELCKKIWTDPPPASAAELADRLGDWADTNRSDRS